MQTGLRTGELIGFKWSDIDFENRAIPLTDEAIRILENQRAKNKSLKLVPIECGARSKWQSAQSP